MRCSAIESNVYKVGWTAKSFQERADDLSRATGVPLFFVVVDSWRVRQPRIAEALAR
jgi:hypothetical protein